MESYRERYRSIGVELNTYVLWMNSIRLELMLLLQVEGTNDV